MKRLPRYDYATSRSEFAAFMCLSLLGVVSIIFAGVSASRFASAREQIIASLSVPQVSKVAVNTTNHAFTNLSQIQSNSPVESRSGPVAPRG